MFHGTSLNSGEPWQQLIELRCRRQIIEGWLASSALSDDVKQNLRLKASEVDDQLQAMAKQLGVTEGERP
jgi:hypothetical protein